MSKTPPQYRLVIFEAIDEPHGAARSGLPGDGDAPDRRRAVAGPSARDMAPAAGGARRARSCWTGFMRPASRPRRGGPTCFRT